MTGGREPIGSVFPNLSSLDTPSTVDNRMNDAGETKVFNSGNVFCNLKGTVLCNIGFPDLDMEEGRGRKRKGREEKKREIRRKKHGWAAEEEEEGEQWNTII